jgi:hypothetical protein
MNGAIFQGKTIKVEVSRSDRKDRRDDRRDNRRDAYPSRRYDDEPKRDSYRDERPPRRDYDDYRRDAEPERRYDDRRDRYEVREYRRDDYAARRDEASDRYNDYRPRSPVPAHPAAYSGRSRSYDRRRQ